MGREKRTAPGAGAGHHAKERHKRDRKGNLVDWTAPLPPGLVARPERPQVSSKHKSWFEFIENKEKKKKLEFEFTERREPPPGFEFVPIGNPALTTACKELSREHDAMIFIVTSVSGLSKRLSSQLNRVGHHIRQTIVEQARETLGGEQLEGAGTNLGLPEPIPEKQEDINKQADAAIRDLFPRIPNTDRQMIIEHAFNKSRSSGKDGPLVGLAPDVTLSRRVQLAVLAHIRHNHTRYDQLLRETAYVNARKAVESLCLDILVKWRGDEETGRDQLDEILCEVIVISDSEGDESDDDEDEDESSATSSAEESPVDRVMRDEAPPRATAPPADPLSAQWAPNNARAERFPRANRAPQKVKKTSRKDRRNAKLAQRNFSRYQAQAAREEAAQAARYQAWHQALDRQRQGNDGPTPSTGPAPMGRSATHGPQPWQSGESGRADRGLAAARNSVEPLYHTHPSHGASLPFVDVSRERATRVNEPQQPIHRASYHMPQHVRTQENQPSNGFRPAVGAQTAPYGAPAIERVSYQGQDLSDYLVQSIEPASPKASNLSSRGPLPYRQPEAGLSRGVERPMRVVNQSQGPAGTGRESTIAHDHRAAFADKGFIELPPRSDPGRMFIPPEQHPEPFILLNPQPANAGGGSATAAVSGASGFRHSSTWQDDASARGGVDLRSRPDTRPVWIGHDGAILRSESRPIVIQGYPSQARQPRTDSAYVPLENRGFSDARHAGPGWADERDRRHADSGIDQRIESLQGDMTAIRVSNKFPRQHEGHTAPLATRSYNLRSGATQQRAPQQQPPPADYAARERYNLRSAAPQQGVSQQSGYLAAQYSDQHFPVPGQRVERVVGRIEVPAFPVDNAPFAARPPDRYARQEQVVGIEYVQTRPSLETRTYSERGPFYDTRGPVYRPRSTSAVPVPYPGHPYQPHPDRPTPQRGEVITLD